MRRGGGGGQRAIISHQWAVISRLRLGDAGLDRLDPARGQRRGCDAGRGDDDVRGLAAFVAGKVGGFDDHRIFSNRGGCPIEKLSIPGDGSGETFVAVFGDKRSFQVVR